MSTTLFNSAEFNPADHFNKPLKTEHKDLIHHLCFDHYGRMLATCSGDRSIKIWSRDRGEWKCVQTITKDIKAPIQKLAWSHPMFGSILAAAANDRTITQFKCQPTLLTMASTGRRRVGPIANCDMSGIGSRSASSASRNQRIEGTFAFEPDARILREHKSAINDIEFAPYNAPHHTKLQLAVALLEGTVVMYEWVSSDYGWRSIHNITVGDTPKAAVTHMKNTAFSLSWNKARWECPTIAIGSNYGRVFIYGYHSNPAPRKDNSAFTPQPPQLPYGRKHNPQRSYSGYSVSTNDSTGSNGNSGWNNLLIIDVTKPQSSSASSSTDINNCTQKKSSLDVLCVDWAPHLARKSHFIAAGCSDGQIRIIEITRHHRFASQNEPMQPLSEDHAEISMSNLEYKISFATAAHDGPVRDVKWNITGTILFSTGDDAKVRMWRRDRAHNQWKGLCISQPTSQSIISHPNKPTVSQPQSHNATHNAGNNTQQSSFAPFMAPANHTQNESAMNRAEEKQVPIAEQWQLDMDGGGASRFSSAVTNAEEQQQQSQQPQSRVMDTDNTQSWMGSDNAVNVPFSFQSAVAPESGQPMRSSLESNKDNSSWFVSPQPMVSNEDNNNGGSGADGGGGGGAWTLLNNESNAKPFGF